jgi:hypothetical protein
MPYCEKHNEVYRAEACPVCTGDATDGAAGERDRADDTSDPTDAVSALVDDALDAVDGDDAVGGDRTTRVDVDVTVDESTAVRDESTTVRDESTTTKDNVITHSNVGGDDGETELEDDGTRCPSCDKTLAADANFCTDCGTELR